MFPSHPLLRLLSRLLPLLLLVSPAAAQHTPEALIERAEFLKSISEGEAALAITRPLLDRLREGGQLDTPLGLRTQAIHGLSLLESPFTEIDSLAFLWEVRDKSLRAAYWPAYVEATRGIALTAEISSQPELALEQIRLARSAAIMHGLDALRGRVAIRYASVCRIFGITDSVGYYAREAIAFGRRFEQNDVIGFGNFLLGMETSNLEQRAALFRRAVRAFEQNGDVRANVNMRSNLAGVYTRTEDYPAALAQTDTALLLHPLLPRAKVADRERTFLQRADAFEGLGLKDSVIVNLRQARAEQYDNASLVRNALLARIARQYELEQQEEELVRQVRVAAQARRQNWLLGGLVTLLLLLIGSLVYAYRRLLHANRDNRRQAGELRAVAQLQNRFFANASHELRTPLSLVIGPVTSLLERGGLDPLVRRLLNTALHGGEQLRQLTDDILDLGKLEAGQGRPNPEPTALRAYLAYQLSSLAEVAARKQLRYDYVIEDITEELVVALDRVRVRQILNNLLSNAIKFTPAGGYVGAAVSTEGSLMTITVSDTGPGIAAEDLPRIFDRYFQTSQTGRAISGGTGIGLALSQEYARLLGGDIGVSRTDNSGTTFYLRLPLRPASASPTPLAARETAGSSTPVVGPTEVPDRTGAPVVLLVEDHPQLRAYLEYVLGDKYRILTAENGRAAWRKLTTRAPGEPAIDLVVTDLMMPEMDGYQLLRLLKSTDTTRHLPVVVLTARVDDDDRLRVLRTGVDDYLNKPFSDDELLVRIANLLTNRNVRRAEVQGDTVTDTDTTPEQEAFLGKLEAHVRTHLSDTGLSVPDVARAFTMSESTLLRTVKRLTGLSTKQYISEIRLTTALRMLERRTHRSVTEIAAACGYADLRTFSRSFKARFGKAPSEFLQLSETE